MTETEQANHIERADIGEANISTLNVGDLQWGKIEELAALTKELESLGQQDNKLLEAITDGHKSLSSEMHKLAESGATIRDIGASFENNGPLKPLSEASEAPTQKKKEPKSENLAPKKTTKEKVGARASGNQLQEVRVEAPNITIVAPDRPNIVKKGARNERERQPAEQRKKPEQSAENPVKSRKNRTVEIGATPATQPLQPTGQAASKPKKAESVAGEPEKAPGFYLGDDGRVRRPDGTFANKVEVRRFNSEKNVDVAEGGNGKVDPSLYGLLARSLGALTSIGGKSASGAGEQAGEVAGVAAGGSIFLAAKEVSGLARDVKEAAEDRGISRMGEIAPYLKKQLGFTAKDGEEGKGDRRRPPKQLAPGEQPKHPADQGAKEKRKIPAGEPADPAVATQPAEKPKSAGAPQPGKPAEQPKTAMAAQPDKPAELPKSVEVTQPGKPVEQPNTAVATQPGRPAEQPKSVEAAQSGKPVEQPKTAVSARPGKPAEQPKPAGEARPDKPAEQPQNAVVTQPGKPAEPLKPTGEAQPGKLAEQQKTAVATQLGKPAEQPKSVEAAQPDKPAEQPKTTVATQPGKPAEQPKSAVAAQPGKPAEQPKSAVATQPGRPAELPKSVVGAQPGKSAELPKSAVASQQDKQAAQLKDASESQLQQAEAQHGEVLKKLDDVIEAIKPKGPSMLDAAFDAAGDMYRRRGKRGRGKARAPRTRLSSAEAGPRQKAGSRVRGGPARPGHVDVDMPRHQPKAATVRAGMGKAMPAMPAVSSAAGRSAGAAIKGGAAMGGAAVGRLAGAGARAIPIVGQALAVGLAAYDGYQGYNDKEAQAKAFGLKSNTEASTGQKSAMAAAQVLDLGGLTSGAAGLIGSAAGAMGFNKIQDAMTFDTDDMARAIYEGMSLFTRRNPEDKAKGGDLTINNMGGGVTPRGVTETTGKWGGTPLKFEGTEAENNLPSGYLAATAAVESGGDPNAHNKSGAAGMFQMMPKTAAGLGLVNPYDPVESTKAMIVHTKQNQAYFEKTMGRTPEGRELYLMHQQGMGGGTKLLKNPNSRATDIVGMQAVLQNGGRADMTSQEFTQMILAKYDKAEAYNKANPGKAIDLDKIVGTKPKHEAPPMLRGGPRPGEQAPPLVPPQDNQKAANDKQPQGQAAAPGNAPAVAAPPAALTAPPVPGDVSTSAVTPTALAAPPTALAVPPVSLRPVSDIQSITIRNDQRDKDKKPYAPGADTDAAMLTVLKSMDKSLKEMGKEKTKSSPAGGPVRAGGKPPVSGHPTMSGSAADFANDRR